MNTESAADRARAGRSIWRSPAASYVVVFLVAWILIVALQWRGGAYVAEFSAYPDEPAHYVTGLLVRDYVAALAPDSPMEYARRYYLHYPKVAFGHWPPVFYALQAVWTLPFSPSRASMMIFMALFGALLAATLFRAVRRQTSPVLGAASVGVLICLPIFQDFSRQVMADLPQALLVFWAVLAYGRYLEKPGSGGALAFAGLASLALLNKATGLILAPLPAVAVLLTRRFRLVTAFSFWLPALLVPLICAPWYLLAPSALHQSAMTTENLISSEGWLGRLQLDWVPLVGIWLLPFVVIGLGATVVAPLVRRRPVASHWAAAAALLASIPIVRVGITAAGELRHALPAVPILLMFAAAGVHRLDKLAAVRKLDAAWRVAALAVAVLGLGFDNLRALPPKKVHGFSEVAEALRRRPDLGGSVFLIASDALGEGMLVSEVAMREKRPGHIVLRGSKVLASSGWMGDDYSLRFENPNAIMEYLDSVPVGIVVLDRGSGRMDEHLRLLQATLTLHRDRWELLGGYPASRSTPISERRIQVYSLKGHEGRPIGPINLHMRGEVETISN